MCSRFSRCDRDMRMLDAPPGRVDDIFSELIPASTCPATKFNCQPLAVEYPSSNDHIQQLSFWPLTLPSRILAKARVQLPQAAVPTAGLPHSMIAELICAIMLRVQPLFLTHHKLLMTGRFPIGSRALGSRAPRSRYRACGYCPDHKSTCFTSRSSPPISRTSSDARYKS